MKEQKKKRKMEKWEQHIENLKAVIVESLLIIRK